MLINGRWAEKWHPYQANNDQGEFLRQQSEFRNWVTADGEPGPTGNKGYLAEANRYHLYVALICPWASRTLMVRSLKKLDTVISVDVVEPFLTEQGWRFGPHTDGFPGSSYDRVNGFNYIHELYRLSAKQYTGRATIPILWDKRTRCIVNNESSDIIQMLNGAFEPWADNRVNLRPAHLTYDIDALNKQLYQQLNNGVYRAGFAKSQNAYQTAFDDVFSCLNSLENRLRGQRFLFSDVLTESDVRLFVTLVRFDAVYFGLFKCNKKRIADYPNLTRYLCNLYDLPGIRKTVNIEHIKTGYYSVKDLNPSRIIPVGPELNFIASVITERSD